MRRILVRTVSGYYERDAARQGRPRAGAVAFVQRFDSGLRLNVHLHLLWLNGVYSREPGAAGVEWCGHAQVTDADVAQIVRRVQNRVLCKLRQIGKWSDPGDAADADVTPDANDGEQLLLALDSAAVAGVAALGERAGQRDLRVGRGTRDEPFVKGPLCADRDGFSLSGPPDRSHPSSAKRSHLAEPNSVWDRWCHRACTEARLRRARIDASLAKRSHYALLG